MLVITCRLSRGMEKLRFLLKDILVTEAAEGT